MSFGLRLVKLLVDPLVYVIMAIYFFPGFYLFVFPRCIVVQF